jgi:hypothetical protein
VGLKAVGSSSSGSISLPVAVGDGGTGATSFTATRLLIGNGTSPITTDAGLTFTGGTLYTSGISSKPLTGNGSGAGNEIFGAGANINSSVRINNTLLGNGAYVNDTGAFSDENVIIGCLAGIQGARRSVAIGKSTFLNALFGENCILIGYNSSASGNFMTIVGANNTITTGQNATLYGLGNTYNSANGAIGIFGNFNTYSGASHRGGGLFGVGLYSLRDRELGIGHSYGFVGGGFGLSFTGETGAYVPRELGRTVFDWVDATDATRKSRVINYVRDNTTEREYLRAESNGTGADVNFNGASYTFAVPVKFAGYTVATLPAGTVGMRAYVTDALAPVFLTALVGGGAITCPAFYNGAAWVAG